MGDRAVFGFRHYSEQDDPLVFLYSHWGGATMETDLGEALVAATERWHDPVYGTRIMVSHLTRDAEGEYGYGLYAGTTKTRHGGDYGYIYIVDFPSRKVQAVRQEDITSIISEVDFDEFVKDPLRLSSDMLLAI